jgi:hypothetical protein
VEIAERSNELAAGRSEEAKLTKTTQRMAHVVRLFDICAEAHLRLVADMASQKDFMVILDDTARRMWGQYTGHHFETLPPVLDQYRPIEERIRHWKTEGFRKLAVRADEPIQPVSGRTRWTPGDLPQTTHENLETPMDAEQTFHSQRMDLLSSQAQSRIEAQAQREFQIEERKKQLRLEKSMAEVASIEDSAPGSLIQLSPAVKPARSPGTIQSWIAVSRMDAYIDAKGLGQTEFAGLARTTDRTIRSFRKTGKVRRDIFDQIAKAMGITREELIKPKPTGK